MKHIKKIKCIAAGGQNPYPNLYGVKAYAYEKLGDSMNAKTFFDTYFQKQNPEKLALMTMQLMQSSFKISW